MFSTELRAQLPLERTRRAYAAPSDSKGFNQFEAQLFDLKRHRELPVRWSRWLASHTHPARNARSRSRGCERSEHRHRGSASTAASTLPKSNSPEQANPWIGQMHRAGSPQALTSSPAGVHLSRRRRPPVTVSTAQMHRAPPRQLLQFGLRLGSPLVSLRL
jgi:hypothetical protein